MAARGPRHTPATLGGDPETRIAALIGAHGAALLRVARQHSLCADDAQDAYQRALEIFLRRMDSVDPATEGAWMKVVTRHEAMAVRRGRTDSVAGEEIDFDAQVAEHVIAPEERLANAERSARSAEVLRRLKPDEATALLLKAEGHSYGEIGERCGWTYTKVNRAITEGRRRFLRSYAELESGEGCEPFRPALSALARGTATVDALLELRPHLRHCPACRAEVRELRGGRRRVAGWLPLPAFLVARSRTLDYESNIGELAGPLPAPADPNRFAEFKLNLQLLLHRLSGSEVATSVQLATSGGGGRGVSLAAALGICLSSVGAGTYCVATLVLPEPQPVERRAQRPAAAEPRTPTRARLVEPKRTPTATAVIRVATAKPTPTRKPVTKPKPRPKPKPLRAVAREAAPNVTATVSGTPPQQRHEDPPPAAPAVVGQQELGIEQSASTAAAQPAAAPATGGGEFSP